MLSNETLTREAAKYKSDSTKRFDVALTALLALAWQYKHLGGDFSFTADPELYAKALAICRDMSDGCLKDAENHIKSLFEEEFEADYVDGEDAIERFDMAGSHLLELLNLWIALAFINGYSQAYTKISIGRWMNNPFASGLFGAWGKDVLKWGRGYDKNLINRLAVIGQNLIIDTARKREWEQEKEKGATYYIRRRGSGYDCPDCDDLCGYPIPIEVPFERLHARCCCRPEYHYDEMPVMEKNGKEPSKEELDKAREQAIRYGRENLIGKSMMMPGIEAPVTFTMKGIKEAANQPHKHFIEKNETIKNILEVGPKSTLIDSRNDDKKRNYYYRYYKTKIAGEDSFIVIRENTDTKLIDFYSIVDAMKKNN